MCSKPPEEARHLQFAVPRRVVQGYGELERLREWGKTAVWAKEDDPAPIAAAAAMEMSWIGEVRETQAAAMARSSPKADGYYYLFHLCTASLYRWNLSTPDDFIGPNRPNNGPIHEPRGNSDCDSPAHNEPRRVGRIPISTPVVLLGLVLTHYGPNTRMVGWTRGCHLAHKCS